MSNKFDVYAPTWMWIFLTVVAIVFWTCAFFGIRDPEPLVLNGTGIYWIDNFLFKFLLFIPLILVPVWAIFRLSSRLHVNSNSLIFTKWGWANKKVYSLEDICETKLWGEKYNKDVLRITFSDGNKVTIEKSYKNFDILKRFLRSNNKLNKVV